MEERSQLKKWLNMALLDLQESKQTEAAALQQASILLKEKELLKEKLNVHLDLWELDKIHLEESSILEKRAYEGTAVAQAFEIASSNIAIGFHQQETLRFKLRLEGAVDDVAILSSRLRVLSLELQEKDDKLCVSNQGFLEREAAWNSNSANQCTEKLVEKIPQADRAQSHLLVLHELTKKQNIEIGKLKSENCYLVSQRKQEVSALIREKIFVWDQLKRMEDSYCARLSTKGDELKLAEENLLKLQCKVDELQKAHDERTVEATILKINLQTVEEELHQLQEELSKLSADSNKGLCSVLLQRSNESTPVIAATNISLSSDEADGCIGDLEQPGTLKIEGEQGKRELPETVPQLSETKELVHVEEELKKTYKVMDELRLENQNLRMLYAELEVQLKDKIGGQKSEKANRNSTKDVTTRNLAMELEAVADVLKQPHVKPAKCLVDKYVHRSKMGRKVKRSPMRNQRVMQKLEDANQGTLTRSCLQHKTTETQFSSLRKKRRLLSSEKKIRPPKFQTSTNKHASTAEETKKVRARLSNDVRLSTSANEEKCQTDPRHRKSFLDVPDKSKTHKRARPIPIDEDASATKMKLQSDGDHLQGSQRKILSLINSNIGIQKPNNGQQDGREDTKNEKGGAASSLGKNRLFSSVFNIPKIVLNTVPS